MLVFTRLMGLLLAALAVHLTAIGIITIFKLTLWDSHMDKCIVIEQQSKISIPTVYWKVIVSCKNF